MKGLLEYLKIENITHPSTSDIQIGMKVDEKFAKNISTLVSNVFESETVTFKPRYNGIESSVTVVSEKKTMQFTMDSNTTKFRYVIKDSSDVLLESVSREFDNHRSFKKDIVSYGETRGWVK